MDDITKGALAGAGLTTLLGVITEGVAIASGVKIEFPPPFDKKILGFPVVDLIIYPVMGAIIGASTAAILLSQTSIRNIEEVTWTDWKDRERKMVIHREVE